ncbi:hypothetical protein Tco_0368977 [Tanacetum coccineum]
MSLINRLFAYVELYMASRPLTRYAFVSIRLFVKPLEFVIPLSRGSFDVIVGMDWLSKRKFVIVCHEKVVRIPLEGDKKLQVHGERTQGVVKTLMNTKVDEPKLSDISVVRDLLMCFQRFVDDHHNDKLSSA